MDQPLGINCILRTGEFSAGLTLSSKLCQCGFDPETLKSCLSALMGSGVIALLFLSSPASAQTPVKVGIISPTFGHAPFYVAREKGFFRKEGLVGEVIVMNRDELIMQALVSDSI